MQPIFSFRYHLKRHENSDLHKKNFRAARSTPSINKVFQHKNMKKSLEKDVKIAEIKLCCYICDQNLPLLLMDTLPDLTRQIFPDSDIAKKVTMKRDKATKIITGVLGPVFRADTIKELKNSRFSLIIDETTDVSTKKSLAIIGRFWSEDENKILDRFIDLVEVENANADALFNIIKKLLHENSIPYDNIIGFGSDNASVMMGATGGVQAKLKEIAPYIYIQGCTCHSLHLCASAAAGKLPNTVEQFARDIYAYFKNSSKRLSELRECQVFAEEKPHKLLYPSQTRWLSLKVRINNSEILIIIIITFIGSCGQNFGTMESPPAILSKSSIGR